MKRSALALLLLALSLSTIGCATIFTGTSDAIQFRTDPAGAKILLDGVEVGRTPATIPVTRSLNQRMVTLRLPGYEDQTFVLSHAFNAVSVLNLFNILFWGIDAASGSISLYDRKVYDLSLDRKSAMKEQFGVDNIVSTDELEMDSAGNRMLPSGRVAVLDRSSGSLLVIR